MADEISIQRDIGELLAKGLSSQELLTALLELHPKSDLSELQVELKSFYSNWQAIGDQLNLTPIDMLNWHILLRHQILQKSLTPERQDLGTALKVLESLSVLQGVASLDKSKTIPLQIELVPRVVQST